MDKILLCLLWNWCQGVNWTVTLQWSLIVSFWFGLLSFSELTDKVSQSATQSLSKCGVACTLLPVQKDALNRWYALEVWIALGMKRGLRLYTVHTFEVYVKPKYWALWANCIQSSQHRGWFACQWAIIQIPSIMWQISTFFINVDHGYYSLENKSKKKGAKWIPLLDSHLWGELVP